MPFLLCFIATLAAMQWCELYTDAQDKALIFQADAETSLLGAIRQVPTLVPQRCTSNSALQTTHGLLCIQLANTAK